MIEIRYITTEDLPEFRASAHRGFAVDTVSTPERDENFHKLLMIDNAIAAFDGDRIVGTFGARIFPMTVPGGGEVQMAGTTMVTVQPTHRRRGVMSAMMDRHLSDLADQGYPLAALWATEVPIYGRFGYGWASSTADIKFSGAAAKVPEGRQDLELRFLDIDEAVELLPPLYERCRTTAAGMLGRTEDWWSRRVLFDDDDLAGKSSRRRILAAFDGEMVVGYLLYRQSDVWENAVPNGTVTIEELTAVDDDTRRRLWSFTANVDLCPNVQCDRVPVDDPLFIEADDPRRIERQDVDALWVRLLDVPAALTARRYERDGSIVIDVDDPTMGRGGIWKLTVVDGQATCEPGGEADVHLSVAELGSLYLGAPVAESLRRAGRINGSADAVGLLAAMFRTERAPFCADEF